MQSFLKAPGQDNFQLEIWDQDTPLQKEKELGIKVEVPRVG